MRGLVLNPERRALGDMMTKFCRPMRAAIAESALPLTSLVRICVRKPSLACG
jgi:hypothetical protein